MIILTLDISFRNLYKYFSITQSKLKNYHLMNKDPLIIERKLCLTKSFRAMKTIVRILLICIIMMFAALNCEEEPKATAPGLAVYKTKGDYFNNTFVFMKSSGRIYMVTSYYNQRYNSISTKIKITENDTVYVLRVKLVDGYVLASEHSKDMAFLNITFKEYLRYEINNGHFPSMDELTNIILDDDPFIEYYHDPKRPRKFELSDSAEINQIIENGELEKYFEKIKYKQNEKNYYSANCFTYSTSFFFCRKS